MSDSGASVDAIAIRMVDHDLWAFDEAGTDPLGDHRPTAVDCNLGGAHAEGDAYEVETELCNYVSVSQPLAWAIPSGARVMVSLFHEDLRADEPGPAHAAVLLAGEVVWESTIDIPSDPAAHRDEVVLLESVPAGAEVTFHLHNHGYNTWKLVEVDWLNAPTTPE